MQEKRSMKIVSLKVKFSLQKLKVSERISTFKETSTTSAFFEKWRSVLKPSFSRVKMSLPCLQFSPGGFRKIVAPRAGHAAARFSLRTFLFFASNSGATFFKICWCLQFLLFFFMRIVASQFGRVFDHTSRLAKHGIHNEQLILFTFLKSHHLDTFWPPKMIPNSKKKRFLSSRDY